MAGPIAANAAQAWTVQAKSGSARPARASQGTGEQIASRVLRDRFRDRSVGLRRTSRVRVSSASRSAPQDGSQGPRE